MLCKNSFAVYIGNGAVYKLVCVCHVCWAYFMAAIQAWEIRVYVFILWLHWVLILSLLSCWNAFAQQIICFSLFGWTTLGPLICHPIVLLSETCMLLTYFFPVETTCNFGLHGYSGKITNYRFLRMRLFHMSSRALGFFKPDLTSRIGVHTSFVVINTCSGKFSF